MKFIGFLLFTAVLSFAYPESGRAALLSVDSGYGSGSLTYDSTTNLEWLDLSVTQGLSFNTVSWQLQLGGQFEGFRYATVAELDTLMANAAISYRDIRQLYFDDAQHARDLIDLLGPTAGGNGEVQSIGILGMAVGFIYWSNSPMHFTSSPYYPFAQASPGGHATPVWGWDSSASRGSFLVRPADVAAVPVPAAAWLLGSGLMGLIGIARHKVA